MTIQTSTRPNSLPRVNLLPPEIGERKRLQLVQAGVVGVVVVAIAAVGYFYYEGRHDVTAAKQQLATATQKHAQLTQELAAADKGATELKSQLASAQAMLAQATSTKVTWTAYLNDLSTLPNNAWLQTVAFKETVAPGTLTDPKQAPPVIGQVSLKGTSILWSEQHTVIDANFADWYDAWSTTPGFTNDWFSTVSNQYGEGEDNGYTQFAASVSLTSAALCANDGSCPQ